MIHAEIEFLAQNRRIVVDKWLDNETISEIFNKKDINHDYFKTNYINLLIDYILDLPREESDLEESLYYMTGKGIALEEVIEIFVVLHRILLDLAIFSMDELDCKVIKAFESAIVHKINSFYKDFIAVYDKQVTDDVNYMLDCYKRAVDASSIVSKTDPKGVITYVNDKFCEISGYGEEELIGQNHNIVRHPRMRSETFATMWKTIKAKKVWRGKVKNLRKDGSTYLVDATIVPVLDARHKIVEYIGIRYNITDIQKNVEKIRAQSNEIEHLKLGIDESTIVSKTDPKGIITYANKQFCELSRYDAGELIGKPHNIVRDPEMPKEAFTQMWDTIRAKKVWKGIVKNRAKDGSQYIVDATIVLILDHNGEISEYIGIRHDITEIEMIKEQMLENKTKILNDYKKAVDASSIVSTTDTKGIITYVNDKFCEISGYGKDELMGRSQNIVRHPDMPKAAFKELWETIERGETWQGTVKNLKKGGGYYIVDATIVPITDGEGKLVEYIGIRKDITKQEQQRQELEKMRMRQMHENVNRALSISYEKVIGMLPLPSCIIDVNDTVVAGNEAFQDLTGWNAGEDTALEELLRPSQGFSREWKDTATLFDEEIAVRLVQDESVAKKLLIKKVEDDTQVYTVSLI